MFSPFKWTFHEVGLQVVTLDTPGSDLPIYEEVKLGLNVEVEQAA